MILGVISMVVIWLVLSALIFAFVAETAPKDRWLTKRLSVRILFVLGGPITIVGLILFAIVCAAIESVEIITRMTRKNLRKFFQPTPSS